LNFLKTLIPDLFILVSMGIDLVAKIVTFIGTIFLGIGLKLHVALDTERGRKIKQIELKVKEMMEQILKAQRLAQSNLTENSRLAQSMKPAQTQEQPQNVISIGKKKDEPTDPKG
jgi:hypothetical protein